MARQRSRISDSVWTSFTETIRFIVVPLVLIDLVKSNWPQLSTAFLDDIVLYTIFFGGLIVASSTLEVANKPGTFKRMLFGLTALAFLCLWLFVVFGGGIASFTFYPYFFRFDMSKIVYIMLIGISLRALLVIRTYRDNKHLVAEQKETKTVRGLFARARPTPAPVGKPPSVRRSTNPAFGSMARVAYEVTADDDVGFAPQDRSPIEGGRGVVDECPVCGAKVSAEDRACPSCGAWL